MAQSLPSGSEKTIKCEEFKENMFVHFEYTTPREQGSLIVEFDSEDGRVLKLNIQYGLPSGKPVTLEKKTASKGNVQDCPGNFPLDRDKPTQLTIWRDSRDFQIYSNHKEWYKFQHELYQSRSQYMNIQMKEEKTPKMNMIFGMFLPRYAVGRVVYIHATAPNDGSFGIELVSSLPEKYDLANIPLKITVNLDDKEVTITHKDKDNNKDKEKDKDKEKEKDKDKSNTQSAPIKISIRKGPFKAGENFRVMIFAQSGGYEIAVAGMHFAFFKYPTHTSIHNMSVQLVNVTEIQKLDYHYEDD